jgi:hypothetical protein
VTDGGSSVHVGSSSSSDGYSSTLLLPRVPPSLLASLQRTRAHAAAPRQTFTPVWQQGAYADRGCRQHPQNGASTKDPVGGTDVEEETIRGHAVQASD